MHLGLCAGIKTTLLALCIRRLAFSVVVGTQRRTLALGPFHLRGLFRHRGRKEAQFCSIKILVCYRMKLCRQSCTVIVLVYNSLNTSRTISPLRCNSGNMPRVWGRQDGSSIKRITMSTHTGMGRATYVSCYQY